MRKFAAAAIGAVGLVASATVQALVCPVPGTTLAWAIDQCLLETGSSDPSDQPVKNCLAQANTIKQPCEWNIAYKQRYCATLIGMGRFEGTLDSCIADPSKIGPTVREAIRANSDEA